MGYLGDKMMLNRETCTDSPAWGMLGYIGAMLTKRILMPTSGRVSFNVQALRWKGGGIDDVTDIHWYSQRLMFRPLEGALCVIDPWTSHDVPGYQAHVEANMRNVLVPLINSLRSAGVQIVYLPSDREINPLLTIDERDWILDWKRYPKDEDAELKRRCKKSGIRTLLYCGYASNLCVMSKPSGIQRMSKSKLIDQIIFVRDASVAFECSESVDGGWWHRWACFEVGRLGGYTVTTNELLSALAAERL